MSNAVSKSQCKKILNQIKIKILERESLYAGPDAARSFADISPNDWQEEVKKLEQVLNLL